jgi:5'-3' exonuclease
MKYKNILCDLSNIFYRNYFVFQDMKVIVDNNEILIGGIYGSIKSINKIINEYLSENGNVYYLLDNMSSRDTIRHSIDPNYKIQRKKYTESFYKGLDYLVLILLNHSNNYYICQLEGVEADDLTIPILQSFDKYDFNLIVSNDMDWARCINKNVSWMKNNIIYDEKLFNEKYGFSPTSNKICLFKSFRGDSSDNIQLAVKGIPQKILFRLMEDFTDIYEIFDKIHKIDYLGKWKDEIIKNKQRLILNWQLVSFIDISYDNLKQYINKAQYNPKTLRSLYKMLGLKISEIDTRLMQFFPTKEEINDTTFFQPKKVMRR